MYLFLQNFFSRPVPNDHSLHSTMYLFLLMGKISKMYSDLTLHSTMYLFLHHTCPTSINTSRLYIPQCIYFYTIYIPMRQVRAYFTFHNVSISTLSEFHMCQFFLLYIPQCIYFYKKRFHRPVSWVHFTFHNVSISTHLVYCQDHIFCTLHSTMYLFLPFWRLRLSCRLRSLHSTMYLFLLNGLMAFCGSQGSFTFHNVSISTRSRSTLCVDMAHLYIPQCIYFYIKTDAMLCKVYILYIPQCIYFYYEAQETCSSCGELYIPQCIYFYAASCRVKAWRKTLHSTMYLFLPYPRIVK